jgi:hypothetical protein
MFLAHNRTDSCDSKRFRITHSIQKNLYTFNSSTNSANPTKIGRICITTNFTAQYSTPSESRNKLPSIIYSYSIPSGLAFQFKV